MTDLFLDTGATWGPGGVESRYRYTLWRHWDRSKGHVLWVMLNPSTADAENDDPTIRRCQGFARAWGYGGVVVVNIFALRSTDPKGLRVEPQPIGPENDLAILAEARVATKIIAAWGNHGIYLYRDCAVRELLAGLEVACLGHTGAGQPKHPLYVAGDVEPTPLLRPADARPIGAAGGRLPVAGSRGSARPGRPLPPASGQP